MKDSKSVFDKIVNGVTAKKHIYGAVFYVSSGDGGIDLISSSGEMKEDTRYYIASINKLFVSAIVLRLCRDGRLDLRDKLSKYLPEKTVEGLHVYKGRDYSSDLAVLHLMSLTSGLPCYLTDRQADGKRAMTGLEAGVDQPWPIDKVVREVKKMKPHFPPGTKGRAKYADTNHQILGLVIEKVAGEPVNVVLNELFKELGLAATNVCEDVNDESFAPIRYKSEVISIPLFLTSTKNDIISTAKDQMAFLKAFFGGYFFPKEKMRELQQWNSIFFPFKYGIGIQKFHMPRIFSPFSPAPDMVGHCGSTGSVAFHVPDMDLYVTGTVNQQARPNIAFQTIIKIINKLK